MKFVLTFLLLLTLCTPTWAQPARFISASRAMRVTSPASDKCLAPALQTGQKSSYWYIQCNGDDAGTPWGGGDFLWKFEDTVPITIATANVRFKILYESRYISTGGSNGLEFNIGGVVLNSACNTATSKPFCLSTASTQPDLDYVTTGTNSFSNARCQGASVSGGTADDTSCTTDSTCNNTNQFCVSQAQYTTQSVTPYVLQVVNATDGNLQNCTVGTCAGRRVTYTVSKTTASTIERDWRLLGLLVLYDQ